MSTAPASQELPDMRPTRRASLSVWRSVLAGQPSYGIQDDLDGRIHRLTAHEYRVYTAIREDRSLGQSFLGLVAHGILPPNGEREFFAFVEKLHQRNLLGLPLDDGGKRYESHRRTKDRRARARLLNFLFLQVPLVSPDRFLDRTLDGVRWLFRRGAAVAWCVLMFACLIVVAANWRDLTAPLLDLVRLENLPVLALVLIALKVVHELGHAYACKAFGGRVPEMGAMFVCLAPLAYVDASSSWAFRRRHRILVGLAGMYFESIVGALCLFVWAATDASLVNTIAYQAFVLATATTVAFNLNPLMRFDGYYVLSDVLDLPNMRQRGQDSVRGWFERNVLRIDNGVPIERRWPRLLAVYGVSAAIYKMFMVVGICAVIATQFHWIGLSLAAFYVGKTVLGWLWSGSRYLLVSRQTAPRRRRAVTAFVAIVGALTIALVVVPVPSNTTSTGVVQFSEQTVVRTRVAGKVLALPVVSGDRVAAGDAIARLDNHELRQARAAAEAQHAMTTLQLEQASRTDQIEAGALAAREVVDRQLRDRTRQQAAQLDVSVERAGQVVWTLPRNEHGAFLPAGAEIATVAAGVPVARFLVDADAFLDCEIGFGTPIRCYTADVSTRCIVGTVSSVANIASHQVRDTQLTNRAGGDIVVDADGRSDRTYFEVVVELPATARVLHGATIVAVLPTPERSLLKRLYRATLRFVDDAERLG